MNLLGATAARVVEKEDRSDEDSDISDVERYRLHAGTLDLVHDTLRGIAAREGSSARTWRTILMGAR